MSDKELFEKYAAICDHRQRRLMDVQETAMFCALRDMLKKGAKLAELVNGPTQSTLDRIDVARSDTGYAGSPMTMRELMEAEERTTDSPTFSYPTWTCVHCNWVNTLDSDCFACRRPRQTTPNCESGQPHIPYSDDPTQCMVCGATITLKHAPECSYWDGLMAQVCNCGASSHGPPECRHSSVKIIKQGESARCLDCGNVISLELRATATVAEVQK